MEKRVRVRTSPSADNNCGRKNDGLRFGSSRESDRIESAGGKIFRHLISFGRLSQIVGNRVVVGCTIRVGSSSFVVFRRRLISTSRREGQFIEDVLKQSVYSLHLSSREMSR